MDEMKNQDRPSEELLNKLEWWIAGLGWARLVIAIVMFLIMVILFSDPAMVRELIDSENPNLVMFSHSSYAITYVFLLMVAIPAFVINIIDIIQMSKVTEKMLGLVLFFLLLRPGYLIWRDHLLGKKLTLGIINIIVHVIYFVIAVALVSYWMFEMIGSMF